MTDLAPSWLTPDQETAQAEPWTVAMEGMGAPRQIEPDDILTEWDPARAIHLHRRVVIKPGFWSQSGLGRDGSVMLCATWQRQGQPLGGSSDPVAVNCDRSQPLSIEQHLSIPAGDAGGILSIRSFILLRKHGRGADPLAATTTGQQLWMSEPERRNGIQLRLEGDGALFPVMGMDFGADAQLHSDASWMLRWSDEPDLDAQVSASFRLLVNTRMPILHAACSSGTEEAVRLRSIIKADVARQILVRLLEEPDNIRREASYAEGTLGRLLWSLLRTTFDLDADPRRIAILMRESPEQTWARIQHAWGMLGIAPAGGAA